MELTYDWKSFQSFFGERPQSRPAQASDAPAYVVLDDERVIAASGAALGASEWIGKTFAELASEFPNREIFGYAREDVERWMAESLPHAQCFDQTEFLRAQAKPKLVSGGKQAKYSAPKNHFLLDAIHGPWAKVLPSSYGIFIRLEPQGSELLATEPPRDLILVVRHGKLAAFHAPDLSSMGPERCRQPGDVVKYLSEKYIVPVQGFFLSPAEWEDWCASADPWKKAAFSIKANRAKLVPFRWRVATLMATRAFLPPIG